MDLAKFLHHTREMKYGSVKVIGVDGLYDWLCETAKLNMLPNFDVILDKICDVYLTYLNNDIYIDENTSEIVLTPFATKSGKEERMSCRWIDDKTVKIG